MSRAPAKRLAVRAVCLATITFVTVAITAGVAWAAYTDNMYPTQYANSGCRDDPDGGDGQISCRTDNSSLSYYMVSSGEYELEQVDRNVVTDVMVNDFAPTDLTVSYDSSPSFSGSAETDIIYQEGSTNISSSDGVTWCNNAAGPDECDQQYIRIRGAGHYVNGLTCHETGYAVGLVHGNQASPQKSNSDEALGCMETPTSSGEGLQANNVENINNTY
ncbi:hypothetical protein [Glycomyces sp. MUSA5-2]|uniref:hypothetical protein n=1 Tax=Glycomyces sp. MUSA5-2 TaxID=2053002 RepID=UPI0030096FD6